MRPIDADKLNERLKRHGIGTSFVYKAAIDTAMMFIDESPTVDTDINVLGKWVSVKERLPELKRFDEDGDTWLMTKTVLVATNKGVTIGYYEDDLDPKFKPGWNDREHGERIKVTHWMELPERPKVSK